MTSDAAREPAPETLARWAHDYIASPALSYKLRPPSLPVGAHDEPDADPLAPLRVAAPGRPPELRVSWDKYKAPRSAEALRCPKKRAHLLHTFLHHELQAAELMCWAVLAFPETPLGFRRGLLHICLDEVRHMNLYAAQIERLGFAVGAFPVRDWFWQRTPAARTAAEFVAVMGLGFEAGNLDHSARYVQLFTEAGDAEAAALQAQVGHEELAHVAFGAHWFRELAGPLAFSRWVAALPAPLSPMVMRGKPLARAARLAAGFDHAFLDELEAWSPALPGC
ncbi:MAG: uncharacterized protein JWN48_1184 [Myxococcaceae bacterium]|nr:uncharacterized protein [Myxococcaceae bacterium]